MCLVEGSQAGRRLLREVHILQVFSRRHYLLTCSMLVLRCRTISYLPKNYSAMVPRDPIPRTRRFPVRFLSTIIVWMNIRNYSYMEDQ